MAGERIGVCADVHAVHHFPTMRMRHAYDAGHNARGHASRDLDRAAIVEHEERIAVFDSAGLGIDGIDPQAVLACLLQLLNYLVAAVELVFRFPCGKQKRVCFVYVCDSFNFGEIARNGSHDVAVAVVEGPCVADGCEAFGIQFDFARGSGARSAFGSST